MDKERQEQLLEEYEDAAFRVLMKHVAQTEGAWLNEETERLESDPDFAVPEEIDRHAIQTIRSAFAKQRRRKRMIQFCCGLSKVAVVFLVLSALFGTAYALSPELRGAVRNVMFDFSNGHSTLTFSQDSLLAPASPVQEGQAWMGYRLPDVLGRFTLSEVNHSGDYVRAEYLDSQRSIKVTIFCGTSMNFDTEDAVSQKVIVNGNPGLLSRKEEKLILSFGDMASECFVYLNSMNVPAEELISFAEQFEYFNQP